MRRSPNDDAVRCRQILHLRGEVRGLPDNIYGLRCIFACHLPHNDEPCLNAETRPDFYPESRVKIGIERVYSGHNAQCRSDSTMCGIFVGNRVTKVD